MQTPDHLNTFPESYRDPSESLFALLPRMLTYVLGLTPDLSVNGFPRCIHAHTRPSLKMRILCLSSVFGLVGIAISQPPNAESYFYTESPISKAGLLANIGLNGAKSTGAKVCRIQRATVHGTSCVSLEL